MRATNDDIEEISHFEIFTCSRVNQCGVGIGPHAPHLTVPWPRGTSRSQVRTWVLCAGTPCQPAVPCLVNDLLRIERSLLSNIRAWLADSSNVDAAA
jgi:hypothetical protein